MGYKFPFHCFCSCIFPSRSREEPADRSGPINHDDDPSVPPPREQDILDALLHGSFPSLQTSKAALEQIRETGALALPKQDQDDSSAAETTNNDISALRFQFGEHVLLGNTVLLSWHDGTKQLAKDKPFRLENGLQVTYGQISALGGDFFAFKEPICFGKDAEEQVQRFELGFATLASKSSAKALAEGFISTKKDEVAVVEKASQPGADVSIVDTYYDSFTTKYIEEMKSVLRGMFGDQEKGYLGLALLNLDHFGADARTAYNAGHTAALRKAASSKIPKNLEDAYAMNAFADHFLQDSFAAGHLRVPRRKLYAGNSLRFDKDICAHAMHSEDNKAGLRVNNPLGETWVSYGDSTLLRPENRTNLAKCGEALATSANEVFEAWNKGTIPSPSSFGAWRHAPTLESAMDPVNHPTMFNKEGYPRTRVTDITCTTYESANGLWTYPATAVKLLAGRK